MRCLLVTLALGLGATACHGEESPAVKAARKQMEDAEKALIPLQQSYVKAGKDYAAAQKEIADFLKTKTRPTAAQVDCVRGHQNLSKDLVLLSVDLWGKHGKDITAAGKAKDKVAAARTDFDKIKYYTEAKTHFLIAQAHAKSAIDALKQARLELLRVRDCFGPQPLPLPEGPDGDPDAPPSPGDPSGDEEIADL